MIKKQIQFKKNKESNNSLSVIPANAQILGAKGKRKNGIAVSVVKYKIDNKEFTAWIPLGGGAA